jgi:hypothetical protein
MSRKEVEEGMLVTDFGHKALTEPEFQTLLTSDMEHPERLISKLTLICIRLASEAGEHFMAKELKEYAVGLGFIREVPISETRRTEDSMECPACGGDEYVQPCRTCGKGK